LKKILIVTFFSQAKMRYINNTGNTPCTRRAKIELPENTLLKTVKKINNKHPYKEAGVSTNLNNYN